jgi:nucleotide-binding universal stress UspA family protein
MSQSPDTTISRMEGCVMLALSTFRQSQKAIDTALEQSRAVKKLMIVYVVDMNLGRYFTDVDHGLIPEWKEIRESDLLQKHEEAGWDYVAAIVERAKKEGIDVNTHTALGRFAFVCLNFVQRVKPSLIVTTRSKRPEWVRKFFGSPVDDLIAKAGCPVIVV